MQRGNGSVIGKTNAVTSASASGLFAMNEVQRATLSSQWPQASYSDPYFKNVTMLLHGDGTNGGQNNTFLDSSTNNFSITRNGNTTQGSFSPYGTLWSNYFDGSSKLYRSMSGVTVGTGQFTAEVWVCLTKAQTTYGVVFKCSDNETWNNGWNIAFDSGGKIGTYNGGGTTDSIQTLAVGTWYHLALTRDSSNALRFFINGVLSGSNTSVTTNYSSVNLNIAGDFSSSYPITGYVSNARIVNGSALYTSNFTPSTTPLTAVSGTQLLTCQSNRFIDNSSNNFALTITGTPSVQRFSPFAPSAAYSTATIGGSAYFDGVGDYLQLPASSQYVNNGSNSITIEFWAYAATEGYKYLMDQAPGNAAAIAINFSPTGGYIYWYNGNTWITAVPSDLNLPSRAWIHFAFVRNGSTTTVYVNGKSVQTGSNSEAYGVNAALNIGRYAGGSINFDGYMCDVRYTNGTAIYTANFTPPSAPLGAVANTNVLLKFQNGAILDNAMMNDLETVGNAQISTSVVKYGTGSLYFDGGGDLLQIPYSPQFDLGAGDFTIEGWVYSQSEGGKYFINVNGSGPYGQVAMAVYGTAKIEVDISTSNNGWAIVYSSPNNSFPLNQWNHVALVRSGSSFTLYINGTGYSVGTNASALYNYSGITCVGSGSPSSYNFQGYIDDLRITKGVARYTANFTPPTAAFTDQ